MPENPPQVESTVDLDLEALVGIKKNVRMPDGNVVAISAPDLESLFKLSKLSENVKGNVNDLTEDEALTIYSNLKSSFVELVPEIEPYKNHLNYGQIFALLDLVVKMAMPSDLEELEKQGITLSDDQKKVLQGYLEPSPTS